MSRYRDQDFIAELSTDQVDNMRACFKKNQLTQRLWSCAENLSSIKNLCVLCLAETTDIADLLGQSTFARARNTGHRDYAATLDVAMPSCSQACIHCNARIVLTISMRGKNATAPSGDPHYTSKKESGANLRRAATHRIVRFCKRALGYTISRANFLHALAVKAYGLASWRSSAR
jgi:hypothetical protein